MIKTGLFFGSFNPVHIGHLIVAGYMAECTDLDEVWFVVSPQNPLKNKLHLISEYDRLEMLKIAVKEHPKLGVSNAEFQLPRPSYTIDTLDFLKDKYTGREWVLIMGTDTAETLPRWKNAEQLLSSFDMYCYPRGEVNTPFFHTHPKIKIFEDAPQINISSSFIRKMMQNGRMTDYMLPTGVGDYIRRNELFQ